MGQYSPSEITFASPEGVFPTSVITPVMVQALDTWDDGWEHARKPLRVWLRPDHGAMLLGLARDIGFELVWATTWQRDANTMIGPVIGLPELPVVVFTDHPGTLEGWKYPAVRDYAAGRPLAWLDDDFGAAAHLNAWVTFMRERTGTPTLLHQVDPRIGITDADMIAIREWAARVDLCADHATEWDQR